MIRFARDRPGRFALGGVLVAFLISHLFLTARWGTNDDFAMTSIVSGHGYGEPSPHMVFTSPVIGVVLSSLYELTASVAWYYWYYVLGILLAHVILLRVVLQRARADLLPAFPFVAVVLAVSVVWFTANIQFTQLSILLAFTGVVVVVAWDPDLADRAIPWQRLLAGAVLVAFSQLVRQSGSSLGLVLSVPVAAVCWFGWSSVRNRLAAPAALLGGVVLARIVQFVSYRGNDPWQEYFAYNRARGAIHSTPIGQSLQGNDALLNQIGWSANDAEAFNRWLFLDRDVFDRGSLETIVDTGAASTFDLQPGVLWSLISDGSWGIANLLLIVMLFGLVATRVEWRRGAGIVLGVLTFGGALLVLVEAMLRLPDRVAFPALVVIELSALVLVLSSTTPRTFTGRSIRRLAPLGAVGLLGLGALVLLSIEASQTSSRAAAAIAQHDANLDELEAALEPGQVVVPWGSALWNQFTDPRKPLRSLPAPMISTGWQTHSPQWTESVTTLGIDSVFRSLAEDPNVLLLARHQTEPAVVESFSEEHFGLSGVMAPAIRTSQWQLFDRLVEYELDPSAGELRINDIGRNSLREIPVADPSERSVALTVQSPGGCTQPDADVGELVLFVDGVVARIVDVAEGQRGCVPLSAELRATNSQIDVVAVNRSETSADLLSVSTDTLGAVRATAGGRIRGDLPVVLDGTPLDGRCASLAAGESIELAHRGEARIHVHAEYDSGAYILWKQADGWWRHTISPRVLLDANSTGRATVLLRDPPGDTTISISAPDGPFRVCGLRAG